MLQNKYFNQRLEEIRHNLRFLRARKNDEPRFAYNLVYCDIWIKVWQRKMYSLRVLKKILKGL